MAEAGGYEKINRITREIVDEVICLLQDNVYKIVLYGSYARGDFTSESDIDVLILLNCSKEQVMQYRKQISRLSSRIGLENDIEIFTVCEAFLRWKEKISQSIRQLLLI